MVVQWLGSTLSLLWARFIADQGTKIPQATQRGKKKKKGIYHMPDTAKPDTVPDFQEL